MIKKNFSTRLKALRQASGLTQKQLAEAIGLRHFDINNCESGTRFTDPEKFVLLADFFHVTADYLLGRTDNPHENKIQVA